MGNFGNQVFHLSVPSSENEKLLLERGAPLNFWGGRARWGPLNGQIRYSHYTQCYILQHHQNKHSQNKYVTQQLQHQKQLYFYEITNKLNTIYSICKQQIILKQLVIYEYNALYQQVMHTTNNNTVKIQYSAIIQKQQLNKITLFKLHTTVSKKQIAKEKDTRQQNSNSIKHLKQKSILSTKRMHNRNFKK
eukprot:TRINITY_DN759_c0_g2_i2.p3 TRINITY_DN759_c0_g2~~TRINITY_DN759_c0_g2_i2.p3  ORF type:complete len:191 (+),score=-2.77 TRINITY_DN759_c0_g2_i2:1466-2038(+)